MKILNDLQLANTENREIKGWKGSEHNRVRVERTGWIPIKMRFQQMRMAGYQLQLQRSQFDYDDFKQIDFGDIVVSPYDDMEERKAKLDMYIERLQEARKAAFVRHNPQVNAATNAADKASETSIQNTSSKNEVKTE